LFRRLPDGGTIHIEDIQDQVELALMRNGQQKIARAYVLYREEHARQREAAHATADSQEEKVLMMETAGGPRPLDLEALQGIIEEACAGIADAGPAPLWQEVRHNLHDGIREADVEQVLVLCARTLLEREPDYDRVAARLLLHSLRREALSLLAGHADAADTEQMAARYEAYFCRYITRGIELELLDPELAHYDLPRLGQALQGDRDRRFSYLGLQTLYDRYFLHHEETRFELPQAFFMRVAMGLAINEIDREARAIEFYELLSSFDFMCSTPTLFNAGTLRPQLSSCYLTTVPDTLDGIYGAIRDNALLSKFAGGLGNDWTRVRGLGARIKGTNGKSQGVVPFLKVANDTAVAVNQGGKRKGAVCAYL
ncbi:MAG TPA: ribonucleoside-diphosphate reductase subunit alpha, partial [Chromatiales bacterium]|nr:ribonucleoside-diphosphate reductase subunit alpha [Chromatiales bacterium]